MRQEPLQPLSLQRWRGRWRPFLLIAFLAPGIPDASEGESALQEMVLAPGFASRVYAEEPGSPTPSASPSTTRAAAMWSRPTGEGHPPSTSASSPTGWRRISPFVRSRTAAACWRPGWSMAVRPSPLVSGWIATRDGVFDYRDLAVEVGEDPPFWPMRTGTGSPTAAATFAEGFDSTVSGLAGGALAWGDSLWFACIPDLWRLRDRDQDGRGGGEGAAPFRLRSASGPGRPRSQRPGPGAGPAALLRRRGSGRARRSARGRSWRICPTPERCSAASWTAAI